MRRAFLAAAAVAVLLAGCGEKRLNTGDLENKLKTELGQLHFQSISCPDGVKVEKGRKFSCSAIGPHGKRSTIEVTLTDDKGTFSAVVPAQPGG